jgi:glutathione S-transferase
MLKIWGRVDSSNVQKVLWCADELGLVYERVDIGGRFGGNKEPAYLALNPNGLVPTIDDDGFVLWESNTILRYLAAKHGKLSAATPAARADAERWMDWQLTVLAPCMVPLFWGWVRTAPEKRDHAALEGARKSAAAAWTILDRGLTGRDFAGGDAFTIGDIPAGCQAWRWFNLPIERPDLPHLRAWFERLMTRPAYRKHVALPLT